VINVKAFTGAKGDGSTDDTAALQAALATGMTVYLPKGVYCYTGQLLLGAVGQELVGEGRSDGVTANGTVLKKTDGSQYGVRVTQTQNRISDITFDGNFLGGSQLELVATKHSVFERWS